MAVSVRGGLFRGPRGLTRDRRNGVLHPLGLRVHSPVDGRAAGGILTEEVAISAFFVSVFDLSPADKLQLVEDLWENLAADPSAVPVHDWQKEELARRKANLMNNPASGLSWDEVKRRTRSRYGR